MAVEKTLDIGAVIAEAIDSHYQYATEVDEWALLRAYTLALIEQILAGKAVLSESFADPKQENHPDYRNGYKHGWKLRHDGGQPAEDPSKGRVYNEGLKAGYEASHHAQTFLGMYNPNKKRAGVEAHKYSVDNIIKPHLERMYHDLPEAQHDTIGRWLSESPKRGEAPRSLRHVYNALTDYNKAVNKPEEDLTDTDPHPADLYHDLMPAIRKQAKGEAMQPARDVELERQHAIQAQPAQAQIRQAAPGRVRMAAPGSDVDMNDEEVQQGLARDKARIAGDLYGQGALMEHLKGNIHHPGVESFLAMDLSQATSPEDAMARIAEEGHNRWKEQVANRLQDASKDLHREENLVLRPMGMPKVERNPQTGQFHTPDEEDTSVRFDPVQYALDRLHHPKGWYSHGASTAAIKKQIPDYHSARGDTRHPYLGSMQNMALKIGNWLENNSYHFNKDNPMWKTIYAHHGVGAGRSLGGKGHQAKKRGEGEEQKITQNPEAVAKRPSRLVKPRRKRILPEPTPGTPPMSAEDVVQRTLAVFEQWFIENVTVKGTQLDSLMEDLYSCVEASFAVLNENA